MGAELTEPKPDIPITKTELRLAEVTISEAPAIVTMYDSPIVVFPNTDTNRRVSFEGFKVTQTDPILRREEMARSVGRLVGMNS